MKRRHVYVLFIAAVVAGYVAAKRDYERHTGPHPDALVYGD